MRRRRIIIYHFSKFRQLAKKFAIVILFIATFILMLLNKTDVTVIEKTTSMATEVTAPIMDALLVPARSLAKGYDYFRELKDIYEENRRLREENRQFLLVSDRARALDIENKILANLLNYTPPPSARFITSRVIAEEGDGFSHSVIVYTGKENRPQKGQVAMGENGLVGRVDRVGQNYAKILLVTDINSKIPVMVERTRVRGILSGDNTMTPKMVFIPLFAELTLGDRIVTSGVAGIFPPGLPVGKISSIEKNSVKIKLFNDLDKLEYVKIVDYGLIDKIEDVEIKE